MSSFDVVLDACVLYPMYLRDTLLHAAEDGLYRLHWSATILEEMRRNIVANGHTTAESSNNLLRMMRSAFPEAEVTDYEALIDSMLNDPKDRHVAAASVKCGAQVIVTENLKDFQKESLAPFDLEAQSSDTFLTHLFYLDPEAIVDIIVRQAADYNNPPMNAPYLIGLIAKHAPGFASLVRTKLHATFPSQ